MKKLLLISLTLCVGMMKAMAVSHTIKTTAQASTSDVLVKIGERNLINVTSLTFQAGSTINSYDIMIIRNRMPDLTYLDMGEVTIIANDHEYYTGYHSENDVLGPYAFYQTAKLETVILPKTIAAIGQNAFSGCQSLKNVSFPEGAKIIMIGNSAFSNCGSLTNMKLPEGLKFIDSGAFQMSGIARVDFPSTLLLVGSSAFWTCSNLSTITFAPNDPTTIRLKIDGGAFQGCYMLNSVSLPPQLRYIGGGAFENCGLTSIIIPSAVQKIEANAFSGCNNLNYVQTEIALPVHIDETTFSTYSTAKVSYPDEANSDDYYFWDTEWNQFLDIHPKNPNDPNPSGSGGSTSSSLSIYFYVPEEKDYDFGVDDVRISGEPNADLNAGSGLIVEGSETQKLGKICFKGRGGTSYNMGTDGNNNSGGEFSSIIGNGNIEAKKLYFDLALEPNRWHFMSFPFKVRISDIVCKGNYIFRYYDSETRAQKGTGGWKDLPANEQYLYPGQGYIFQTDYYSNDWMGIDPWAMGSNPGGIDLNNMNDYGPDPTISIPVEAENLDFSGADKSNNINPYPSSSPENASWNFMGNPYPSYFDLDDILYEGPVTVWNGTSYECVRKGDDVYHFRPLEGFFVQKPENLSTVVFQAAGRHTYSQWDKIKEGKAGTRAANVNSRQLINLTLSGESATDKTRVVFNPVCSESYEIGTDASKFIAANTIQLYSIDNEAVQYAINERPAGEVRLGYVATKGGEMTISAGRMDAPVALYDKMMNVTSDLSKGAYTFSTQAGTFNDRFVLLNGGHATHIDAVNVENTSDGPVYTLDGRRVEQVKANRVYITNGKKVIKK